MRSGLAMAMIARSAIPSRISAERNGEARPVRLRLGLRRLDTIIAVLVLMVRLIVRYFRQSYSECRWLHAARLCRLE